MRAATNLFGPVGSRLSLLLQGPRLQVFNLATFYTVIAVTLDYPNPLHRVAASVALAAALDVAATRFQWGTWRFPWGTVIATMGIWLLLDGYGWPPYLLIPLILVASKHLIRVRGSHLFNANNLAACVLILVGLTRVGVNDWGAAPQAFALLLLFGAIATTRVHRFALALTYLALSGCVYSILAAWQGLGAPTAWAWAFSPVNVMIGFFAVTDPATSPPDYRSQFAYALLVVLLAVPATLAGRPDAPVFALLVAAPQRHWIQAFVRHLFSARGPAAEPAPLGRGGGVP